MDVAALARALPSLRGVVGVEPFRPAVLAHVVCAELVSAQHAISEHAAPTKYLEAIRAAAAHRFAAASAVLMSLPASSGGPEELSMYVDLGELWTVLHAEDRAAFAACLASSDSCPAEEQTEAILVLAERVAQEFEEDPPEFWPGDSVPS